MIDAAKEAAQFGLIGEARGGDRSEPAAVERHRVLADLQDDRPGRPVGADHDRLRVFQRDHVEGGHGRTFVGETRSPMQWAWRTEPSRLGNCSIRDVVVTVNAQITLPRWTPPADTEPGLVTEWKRFLTALEVHEAGHKDISARAGREIRERLRGLSEPCPLIGSRANDIARTIVERIERHPTLPRRHRM